VTGLSYFSEAIVAKRLELLKELVPGLVRVGVLRNPLVPSHPIYWKDTGVAAQRLGVVRLPRCADSTAKLRNAQALLVFDDILTMTYRSRIFALAASSRLPAMYGFREFPDAGGLMSYGVSDPALWWRIARFVDKILKGAKPADLPVEQPTKFELVINFKTAKARGLTVPPTPLARANEAIE